MWKREGMGRKIRDELDPLQVTFTKKGNSIFEKHVPPPGAEAKNEEYEYYIEGAYLVVVSYFLGLDLHLGNWFRKRTL